MQDEMLDLVDEHDNVVGSVLRSYIYKHKLFHQIRAVWLFIVNDQGKLWIPRRTKNKSIFPSALDGSMAGHIGQGETYEQALHREVSEELNIDLSCHKYHQLGYLSPFKDDSCAFTKVYELKSNSAPNYNKDDFCEYFWLTPQEVVERIEHGEPAKSDLSTMMRIFYKAPVAQ